MTTIENCFYYDEFQERVWVETPAPLYRPCWKCGGEGWISDKEDPFEDRMCPYCNWEGQIEIENISLRDLRDEAPEWVTDELVELVRDILRQFKLLKRRYKYGQWTGSIRDYWLQNDSAR